MICVCWGSSPLAIRTTSIGRLGATYRLTAPEILGARTFGLRRVAGRLRGALCEQALEVRPADANPPADAQCRERALIDPVADGLLVELEQLGHLRDRQERLL